MVAVADEKGPGGAGVRISGVARENQAAGTTDWQTITHEFEIADDAGTVELIAELRASSGQVYFELGSLRLVRVVLLDARQLLSLQGEAG